MMPAPVAYYHRQLQRLETEIIYGEDFLRWAYETGVGRAALHTLVKRPFFSKYYGWLMDRPASKKRVLPFIEKFQVDADEFAELPESFPNFNAFFARALKPEARPIDPHPRRLVFPADGRHLLIPNLVEAAFIYAKGRRMDLAALLGSPALAETYARGALLISRLCPTDYHRYHFPWAGIPGQAKLINGALFSVNPIALSRTLGFFWQNKRMLTKLATEEAGDILILEIGATCVGKIIQSYQPDVPVAKGGEKGHFLFGGSCVMTFFEPGRVQFDEDLLRQSTCGYETYALMGEGCASLA